MAVSARVRRRGLGAGGRVKRPDRSRRRPSSGEAAPSARHSTSRRRDPAHGATGEPASVEARAGSRVPRPDRAESGARWAADRGSRASAGGALNDRIARDRILIAVLLGVFLVLALLSALVDRTAPHRPDRPVPGRRAPSRCAATSASVPVEGNDEFAALGVEFNNMSAQLAGKIEEVQRKRAELEDTIRRVGEAFATGLDREGIVNLAVRTAVDACEADGGRVAADRRAAAARRCTSATTRRRFRPRSRTPSAPPSRLNSEIGRRAARLPRGRPRGAAAGRAPGDRSGRRGRTRSPFRSWPSWAAAAPWSTSACCRSRVAASRSTSTRSSCSRTSAARPRCRSRTRTCTRPSSCQAVTDELTGLYNLRHFHETLGREIERSRRFGTPVGLVMIDIDDFKKVNDTLRPPAGRRSCSSKVARVLRELSRDIDEPARYGGEEMAVILPQTDLAGAELAAERMRAGDRGNAASNGSTEPPRCRSRRASAWPRARERPRARVAGGGCRRGPLPGEAARARTGSSTALPADEPVDGARAGTVHPASVRFRAMGLLDDAIKEHLELKRKHGAPEQEVQRQQEEALGPVRREAAQQPESVEGDAAEAEAAAPEVTAEEAGGRHRAEPLQGEEEQLFDGETFAAEEPMAPVEEEPAPPVDEEPAPPVEEEPAPGAGRRARRHASARGRARGRAGAGRRSRRDPGVRPVRGRRARGGRGAGGLDGDEADVLEDTPDFLQETPEHDRLWFEQKPPRDFDFE